VQVQHSAASQQPDDSSAVERDPRDQVLEQQRQRARSRGREGSEAPDLNAVDAFARRLAAAAWSDYLDAVTGRDE